MSGVQSLAEAKDFSFGLCIQTSSEAHRASYSVGTWGCFPRGKAWLEYDADHSLPFRAEVKNEYKLYLLFPLSACIVRSWTALLFTLLLHFSL
jgi:hypothetical protein